LPRVVVVVVVVDVVVEARLDGTKYFVYRLNVVTAFACSFNDDQRLPVITAEIGV